MGFKVVVIGTDNEGEETRETVHETADERRVTKVHVLTRSGEVATIGVDPDQGDMALTFDYAPAGQLHVSDLDNIKLGYEPNLTGEEVAAREEKLGEIRKAAGASASDVFTQDAVDAQREAEEAAEQSEEERQAEQAETDDTGAEPYAGDTDLEPEDEGTDKGKLEGFTLEGSGDTPPPDQPSAETPSPEGVPENRGESVGAEKGEAVPGFSTS